MSKILMVLTSHNILGSTGRPTGFWLEEFAAPYYVFHDAGQQVTLASPKGGQPPIDPKSDDPANQTASMTRFKGDKATQAVLASTVKLADMRPPTSTRSSIRAATARCGTWPKIRYRSPSSRPSTTPANPSRAVCHAPGVLRHVTYQGEPLVKGKRVTGFTNEEEEAVQLTNIVPFLVEDELKRLGGLFEKVANWRVLAITDGRLITGQNPASSTAAGQALLKYMNATAAERQSAESVGNL